MITSEQVYDLLLKISSEQIGGVKGKDTLDVIEKLIVDPLNSIDNINGNNSYEILNTNTILTSSNYFAEASVDGLTFTLPTAVGNAGKSFVLILGVIGTLTIATTGAETINGVATASLTSQYESITVTSNGTNYIITEA